MFTSPAEGFVMNPAHGKLNRPGAALLAGGAAIVLNTLALSAADLFDLETAHGGLLRLIVSSLPSSVDRLGIASTWAAMNGPPVFSKTFQTGFHLFVGLLMALFYAFVLEPFLPRSTAAKGWIYAIGVWLINASIVLPASGEGFAGSAYLTVAGMLWYAASHTLFFLALAYGFALLTSEPNPVREQ
jgi:hypothetical protein